MKATKKILGAAAALVLSLGIATGSTYAWFASNSTATVDSFDVSVTSSANNLLVAVGSNPAEGEFKSLLTASEISTAIQDSYKTKNTSYDATKQADPLLDAVTSEDGITIKDSTGTAIDATSGKYATFTLTFKSNAALSLMLDYGSEVTSPEKTNAVGVEAWKSITVADYGSAVAQNSKIPARAANATRISFVTTDSEDKESAVVWSPNEALVTGGETSGDNTVLVEAVEADESKNIEASDAVVRGKGFWKGNLAEDYNNYISGVTKVVKQTSYDDNVSPLAENSTAIDDVNSTIVDLKETSSGSGVYKATVKINIWLEGTDGDCFDSIFSDKIKVALNFIALAS